ncbi:M28 family peptidase [Solirubrobacter ginsenosidimutans]|uniref:M28 family peptidase n=1 Tax=Solirubrobacter ginsenosidimutans TaxID=490573 RepID=UPI0022CDCECA|nr:M28 family peptidase [Solirubrobacter ginsenosidimutans]
MLDARVYRTAFLPALFALFIAAFALADRPDPARTSLPSDAFTASRAFGSGANPEPQSLNGLAQAFPDRTAGSSGDNRMADLVEQVFKAPDDAGQRAPFTVKRLITPSRAGDLTTVIATRPGQSERRIVVLAHRDGKGLADLSGTATLLELARVLKSRELRKTLVLVSTSGSTTGFAGARDWAKREGGDQVDGVIVLGDMAGTKLAKPWVVGWPQSAGPTPLGLERTLQASVRREVRSEAGGPRALGQWIRRALPITVSEQGAIGGEGLPAALLSESGERGPAADERVLETRMDAFGKAALDAVGAIDAAGPRDGPAFGDAPKGIVTLRNVLPDWGVRLVVGSLLLPALLAALDAFFRARRRRVPIGPWLAWLAVAAVPLPVAWLWLRVLGAADVIEVPDGPVLPHLYTLDTSGYVAMGSALLAGALACALARFAAAALGAGRMTAGEPDADGVPSRRARPVPGVDGLAVASGVWICALAAITWAMNPYAAGVLLLATHLWLFAAGGWRRWPAFVAVLAGLAPIVLIAVYYKLALDLGPLGLAWGAALAAASGSGLWSTLLLAGVLAAFAGVMRVLFARRRLGADGPAGKSISTRGPLSYAGPGSLGGTESALRR